MILLTLTYLIFDDIYQNKNCNDTKNNKSYVLFLLWNLLHGLIKHILIHLSILLELVVLLVLHTILLELIVLHTIVIHNYSLLVIESLLISFRFFKHLL